MRFVLMPHAPYRILCTPGHIFKLKIELIAHDRAEEGKQNQRYPYDEFPS